MRLKIITLACLLTIAIPVQAGPEEPTIPMVPTTFDEIESFLEWLGEFVPFCVKPYGGSFVSAQETKDATVQFINGLHTIRQGSGNEVIITPVDLDGNPEQSLGISITHQTAGAKCIVY